MLDACGREEEGWEHGSNLVISDQRSIMASILHCSGGQADVSGRRPWDPFPSGAWNSGRKSKARSTWVQISPTHLPSCKCSLKKWTFEVDSGSRLVCFAVSFPLLRLSDSQTGIASVRRKQAPPVEPGREEYIFQSWETKVGVNVKALRGLFTEHSKKLHFYESTPRS